jgi:hypothetical protein
VILSSGIPPTEPVPGTTFLPKPYRADGLVKVVRAALDVPRPPNGSELPSILIAS